MSLRWNGQLIEFTNAAGLPTKYTYDNKGRVRPPAKIPCWPQEYLPSSVYRTDVDTPALGKSGERVDAWGSPHPDRSRRGMTTFRYAAAGTLQSIVAPRASPGAMN